MNKNVGKLIIRTHFSRNPTTLPITILTDGLNVKKKIIAIIEKKPTQSVVCTGELSEVIEAEQIDIF